MVLTQPVQTPNTVFHHLMQHLYRLKYKTLFRVNPVGTEMNEVNGILLYFLLNKHAVYHLIYHMANHSSQRLREQFLNVFQSCPFRNSLVHLRRNNLAPFYAPRLSIHVPITKFKKLIRQSFSQYNIYHGLVVSCYIIQTIHYLNGRLMNKPISSNSVTCSVVIVESDTI